MAKVGHKPSTVETVVVHEEEFTLKLNRDEAEQVHALVANLGAGQPYLNELYNQLHNLLGYSKYYVKARGEHVVLHLERKADADV